MSLDLVFSDHALQRSTERVADASTVIPVERLIAKGESLEVGDTFHASSQGVHYVCERKETCVLVVTLYKHQRMKRSRQK